MSEHPATAIAARARQLFQRGYYCSEAVVIAVGDHYLGKTPDLLLRASTPFGGGVGCCHEELCGALSGGVLVLGTLMGRTLPTESDEHLRALVCLLRDRFQATLGHTQCKAIRDSLPEVKGRCEPVVEQGARLVVELIEAER